MKPIRREAPHCDNGPIRHYYPNRGWVLKYTINGKILSEDQAEIAEGILTGRLFHKLPLYINHPIFKYFAKRALENEK